MKTLSDFIKENQKNLIKKINKELTPVYNPKTGENYCEGLNLNKTPFPAQAVVINALLKGLLTGKRALGIVAEMGCGKTLLSLLTAYLYGEITKKPVRTLIVCPPQIVSTWEEEIRETFGDKAKIINLNNPDALNILLECREHRKKKNIKPEFYISGFNRVKTHFKWEPNIKKNKIKKILECPFCGVDVSIYFKNTNKMFCPKCKQPLFGVAKNSRKQYAPAIFIKKYLKRYFDFLIADEVHQLKGSNSIQGAMLGQLAVACKKILFLTGTLSGGKASDIFYIIQRAIALNFDKNTRKTILPHYSEVKSFVEQYGVLEQVRKIEDADKVSGRNSKNKVSLKEKPGISPMVLLNYFIENIAFLRISDMASSLPKYEEIIEFVEHDPETQTLYEQFESSLVSAAREAMRNNDMTVLGKMLSSLLAWADFPQEEVKITNKAGDLVAYADKVELNPTPKDERLIEILADCKDRGRKALIYVEYTGSWAGDIRVAEMLKENGFSPLLLKPNIPASKRLDWIRDKISTGDYDCLVCNPRLVGTGLNLREFPEIIFYQTGYSIYTLRQAARRSYRPGQKQDVVVRYLIYQNTLQEKAMSLIASKLQASLMLEGELTEDGLSALAETGDSLALELAKAMTGDIQVDSLEKQFEALKNMELKAQEELSEAEAEKPTTVVEETKTTISSGDQQTSFSVRRVVVGRVKAEAHKKRAIGTAYGQKLLFYQGAIYLIEQDKTLKKVGEYQPKSAIEMKVVFKKQPNRKFKLVRKTPVWYDLVEEVNQAASS